MGSGEGWASIALAWDVDFGTGNRTGAMVCRWRDRFDTRGHRIFGSEAASDMCLADPQRSGRGRVW